MAKRSLLAKGLTASMPMTGDLSGAPALVAFDFDGTLTARDSFTDFLKWRCGRLRWTLGLIRLTPAALAYLLHRSRGRLKAAMVREFLKGAPLPELEAQARDFAQARAPRLLRPDALAVWRRWRSKGARMVIVTASPEVLVAPFARGLGADLLIGTRLAFGINDRCLGVLAGPNCRGPEKAVRLREAFGDDVTLTAAYGDTAGDREMLALAEEKAYRVFRGRPG